MTIALVTTALTAPALAALEGDLGWNVLNSQGCGTAERRRVRLRRRGCARRRVRLS